MNGGALKRLLGQFCLAATLLAALSLCPVATAWAQVPVTPAINVERFKVSGNTLLDPALVEATLAPFKGPRTVAELRGAAEALQKRYTEAGYGGVLAYVPPQSAVGGEVAITVLEGKLKSVAVRGNVTFDDANIRASVPDLITGSTPQVRRIDTQVLIANENPAKRVQVLLKPGAAPGEIAAELSVQDKPLQTMTFGIDDTGNARTGKYRGGLSWQHANVSGNDDVLTTLYQTSPTKPGQVTVLSAAYRYPLPRWMAVIDAYAAYSDVDAGTSATAAGAVRINGRGNLAGVHSTWVLPRFGDADQRLAAALDRREYRNRCDVAGLPSGACGPAGADIAVTPLSLEYSLRSSGALVWGGTLTLLRNLELGGRRSNDAAFAAQRLGALPGFSAVRFSGAVGTSFAEAWQLRLRWALQLTGDALVSGEQFGIGGASAVRGYEERELVGDHGVQASLELTGPEMLNRQRLGAPSLRAFAFADGGSVGNALGAPCRDSYTRCSLASVGLGLMAERERLQARVAVAVALRDAALTRRNDTRAHFSATYSF